MSRHSALLLCSDPLKGGCAEWPAVTWPWIQDSGHHSGPGPLEPQLRLGSRREPGRRPILQAGSQVPKAPGTVPWAQWTSDTGHRGHRAPQQRVDLNVWLPRSRVGPQRPLSLHALALLAVSGWRPLLRHFTIRNFSQGPVFIGLMAQERTEALRRSKTCSWGNRGGPRGPGLQVWPPRLFPGEKEPEELGCRGGEAQCVHLCCRQNPLFHWAPLCAQPQALAPLFPSAARHHGTAAPWRGQALLGTRTC